MNNANHPDEGLSNPPPPAEVKILLIGDANCGKTALISAYTQSIKAEATTEYIPTIQESCSVHLTRTIPKDQVGTVSPVVKLVIMDSSGSEDYDSLRKSSYSHSNVILICFSVVSPASFKKVSSKWIADRETLFPRTPFILVGLKSDERSNKATTEKLTAKSLTPISTSQAKKLAEEIGADAYVECSSATLQNIKNAFEEAVTSALVPKKTGLMKLFSNRKTLQLSEPSKFTPL